jgi:hypothetical protein
MSAVFEGVEFIYVGCGHAKRGFYDRSGDIADTAVVVAVNAEREVRRATNEPSESLDDPHRAGNMARSRSARVASVLAFFAMAPVFFGTVLDKNAADRRTGRAELYDSIDGNADIVI